MRILIVTNTYPPADISGVGVLVHELAHQLGTSGHPVRVLTRQPPADDPYAIATAGPKLLFPLLAGWRYLRLAARQQFDLVHVHESDGVLVALALRLLRLLRRPSGRARLVATLQVSYRQERLSVRPVRSGTKVVSHPTPSERRFAWLRAPLLSVLGRLTAHLADAVVAPSRVTAQEIEDDYGTSVAAVIPNGVTPDWHIQAQASAPARPSVELEGLERPLILYAGRMRTRKAAAVLLEAFARLQRQGVRASLALAGDGEHRATLEAHAHALELGDTVCFLGAIPRAEMVRWYQAADLFCLPSIYEGFPLAILEAMACGLPVVSTTVSGIPEAVDDGVTGLLVEPEDDQALADALERLIHDADLRQKMGAEAQRVVAERFAIDVVSRAYLDLWQSLV